jgi:hypothetical protein
MITKEQALNKLRVMSSILQNQGQDRKIGGVTYGDMATATLEIYTLILSL